MPWEEPSCEVWPAAWVQEAWLQAWVPWAAWPWPLAPEAPFAPSSFPHSWALWGGIFPPVHTERACQHNVAQPSPAHSHTHHAYASKMEPQCWHSEAHLPHATNMCHPMHGACSCSICAADIGCQPCSKLMRRGTLIIAYLALAFITGSFALSKRAWKTSFSI